MKDLGVKIKDGRTRLGMSQEAFAEKIGIARESFSNIESDKNDPTLQHFADIVKALGVSADYLLGFSDNRITVDNLSDESKELLNQFLNSLDKNKNNQ